MATAYLTPGIYIEEVSSGAKPIQAVGTSTVGFVGVAPSASSRVNQATSIVNWTQFVKEFVASGSPSTPLSQAVYGFFLNGGGKCYVVNVGLEGSLTGTGTQRAGLEILEEIDEVAIVAAPGYCDAASYEAILSHCEKLKDRVAILDAPAQVSDLLQLTRLASAAPLAGEAGGARPRQSDGGYGAFYFPHILVRDALNPKDLVTVPPSGHLAGIYARVDAGRGVHKAPANETIRGAIDVARRVTAEEQGELNVNGVNCLRLFPLEGIRVWGARTLAAASSEWRYINVRRLFNMIEESIAKSTRWVVFEPNDVSLWKAIRRDISAFLLSLWRQGALMGATPEEAFFVKCDAETNPQDVIDAGQVVAVIGVAPVKPAEFVIFRIGQTAKGTELES